MMYNTLRGILKIMMFKKLVQKLNIEKEKTSRAAINPIDVDFDTRKNDFLNKLTQNAVKMYERKCDVKNFTKLVLSDPENTSHNDLVNQLFKHGVIDPADEKRLLELSDNTRFLKDLGLME